MNINSWILEEFQIKFFAEKLKNIAKSDFGGVGKLAEKLKEHPSWVSNYTSGSREPKANVLFRFAKVGIDINKLLTGESYVDKGILEEIKAMREEFESRITSLESELYRKEKENEQLKKDKETLLSQVSSLNEIVSKNKFMNKP